MTEGRSITDLLGGVRPYYLDERAGIAIVHADCRDVLPTLPPASVDLVLTDPPYDAKTHDGARTVTQDRRLIDFEPMGLGDLTAVLGLLSTSAKRWLVATMDWRHVARLEACPPAGWEFVRFGIWVKPNGTPQFTGDRPAPGWEAIVFLHRSGVPKRWAGGGRSSVFIEPKVNGHHPTEKPLPLIRALMLLFSDPGDIVLDPFMGSGTTLRAAKDLGRMAIGIEIEERYVEIAVKRLAQEVLPLEARP